jgi:hypothetical protein
MAFLIAACGKEHQVSDVGLRRCEEEASLKTTDFSAQQAYSRCLTTIEATMEEEQHRVNVAKRARVERDLESYRECLARRDAFIPLGREWKKVKQQKSEISNGLFGPGSISTLETSLERIESTQRLDKMAISEIDKAIASLKEAPPPIAPTAAETSSVKTFLPSLSIHGGTFPSTPTRRLPVKPFASLQDAKQARLLKLESVESNRKEVEVLRHELSEKKQILRRYDEISSAMGLGEDPADLQVQIRMECKPNQFNVQDYVSSK